MPPTPLSKQILDSEFAQHVQEGLSAPFAHLSSKYIYDEEGSKLFQQIMGLESYYLTKCEYDILKASADSLYDRFSSHGQESFELIELGAGDGLKTKLLLQNFTAKQTDFIYRPVDISADILTELETDLNTLYPNLKVEGVHASYMEALDNLQEGANVKRVILFLGSNIGNFSFNEAQVFVGQIAQRMRKGDLFLLGIDLRKNPRTILAAYDDHIGVTANFNLNLLARINRELGGNFDVSSWGFYPLYNPETGEVRSYLYPRKEQHVSIPSIGVERTFTVGEVIHTEVSRKYSHTELAMLGTSHGLERVEMLQDKQGYFADVVYCKQ